MAFIWYAVGNNGKIWVRMMNGETRIATRAEMTLIWKSNPETKMRMAG